MDRARLLESAVGGSIPPLATIFNRMPHWRPDVFLTRIASP